MLARITVEATPRQGSQPGRGLAKPMENFGGQIRDMIGPFDAIPVENLRTARVHVGALVLLEDTGDTPTISQIYL